MASNIDSDTESIISVELDVPSDNQIDLPEGTLSDSSSTNDGTGLLQELESLSDFVEGEQYENMKMVTIHLALNVMMIFVLIWTI